MIISALRHRLPSSYHSMDVVNHLPQTSILYSVASKAPLVYRKHIGDKSRLEIGSLDKVTKGPHIHKKTYSQSSADDFALYLKNLWTRAL